MLINLKSYYDSVKINSADKLKNRETLENLKT